MMFNDSWVEEKKPCKEGLAFLNKQTDKSAVSVINALVVAKHYDWADWALTRSFTKRQNVVFAIYAAEQVIDIFEKEVPGEERPRASIETAKRWLKGEATEAECKAAADAAYASSPSYAASSAYYAASSAASSAYYGAHAAASSASYAAATSAAATSAYASAVSYAYASYAMREKIIAYGLTLLCGPKKRKSSKRVAKKCTKSKPKTARKIKKR